MGGFTKCRLFSQATYLAPRFPHPTYLVEPLTRVMEEKTATYFSKGFSAFANLAFKAKITIHMHGTSSLSQELLFTEELWNYTPWCAKWSLIMFELTKRLTQFYSIHQEGSFRIFSSHNLLLNHTWTVFCSIGLMFKLFPLIKIYLWNLQVPKTW